MFSAEQEQQLTEWGCLPATLTRDSGAHEVAYTRQPHDVLAWLMTTKDAKFSNCGMGLLGGELVWEANFGTWAGFMPKRSGWRSDPYSAVYALARAVMEEQK